MHARQKLIFGEEGQWKIEQSKVAIVGMGALGTAAAELLLRAGVKRLVIIDRDVVEESNLQRQNLYAWEDIGKLKTAAAKGRLEEINPSCIVEAHAAHLSAENIKLLDNAGLVLDCTDNQQTRFVLNDYCRKNGKRWVYGAAIKMSGYVMPVLPEGPCLRCFMKETQLETCEQAGVLNTITIVVAALQVQLALELLMGKEILPRLYHIDMEQKEIQGLSVKKAQECNPCRGIFTYLGPKEETKIVQFCGSGRYQVPGNGQKIDLAALKERLQKVTDVIDDGGTLQFDGVLLFEDGRALVKANSGEEALSKYGKWVGN